MLLSWKRCRRTWKSFQGNAPVNKVWSKISLPCVAESTNKEVPSKAQNSLCRSWMGSEPNLCQRTVLGQRISQCYTALLPKPALKFCSEREFVMAPAEGNFDCCICHLWRTAQREPEANKGHQAQANPVIPWTKHYKAPPWKNTDEAIPLYCCHQ